MVCICSYYKERGVEYDRVEDYCLVWSQLVQSSLFVISLASISASPSLTSSAQLQLHNLLWIYQTWYHCLVDRSLIISHSLISFRSLLKYQLLTTHLIQDYTAHPTPEFPILVASTNFLDSILKYLIHHIYLLVSFTE